MNPSKFSKRIKRYAVVSFLVPLIAINACLLIYKLFGAVDTYPNFEWNKSKFEVPYEEYEPIIHNYKTRKFTNCPKYQWKSFVTTNDNEIIERTGGLNDLQIIELQKNNKIKSIIHEVLVPKSKNEKIYVEKRCIKNYPVFYFLFKNLGSLESKIVDYHYKKDLSFSEINNPYFYGEVSISRTARNFPTNYIFKPLIIFSSLMLFFYWKNNLNFFMLLKNQNKLSTFSKKFFYFGVASCIFLILHALFLGVDFDSKVFSKARRLILILFIFFELAGQFYLTKTLYLFKKNIKEFIFSFVLNLKILFVILMLIITIISFIYLAIGDPSTSFKHILEWNYFSILLIFYLLSRILWR